MTETGRLQQRLRLLPSLCGVYFVLALSLFPHLGMALVCGPGRGRRRFAPCSRSWRFRSSVGTPGVGYRGLRTVAFDGCHSLHMPDTTDNRAWLGRVCGGHSRLPGTTQTGALQTFAHSLEGGARALTSRHCGAPPKAD
ncbi:transposase domain-containing protein [Saccharopolyspora shandongensis]|uniref:transposase domain-containing protein n=1 Tax=Saccharopolyspora shandongensis TaxID=418495 RepID=UPI0015A5A0AA